MIQRAAARSGKSLTPPWGLVKPPVVRAKMPLSLGAHSAVTFGSLVYPFT